MSGHHPWPPSSQFKGRLNPDLQIGKREVFRFGNWSIYDATKIDGDANWSSFIMHCASWEEWKPMTGPLNVNTWIKNETVFNIGTDYKKEKIIVRCNENMVAYDNNRCPGCNARIPNEVQALWKLQNFEQIQKFSNG